MAFRIFLAGASGVIGRRLTPLLREAGHQVTGTTRSPEKFAQLEALGAQPVAIDVFDAEALTREMISAGPDIVIHQLTDLPRGIDPGKPNDTAIAEARIRNARLRREGTDNLVRAAISAGVRKVIAQSIAWAYAPGATPYFEDDPLDVGADGMRGTTVGAVAALEDRVLNSPPLSGIVLRYGQLYGPGTGTDTPPASAPLHVEAAAHAALLAIDYGSSGIFNIAESNGEVSTEKARRELGFDPDFRLPG